MHSLGHNRFSILSFIGCLRFLTEYCVANSKVYIPFLSLIMCFILESLGYITAALYSVGLLWQGRYTAHSSAYKGPLLGSCDACPAQLITISYNPARPFQEWPRRGGEGLGTRSNRCPEVQERRGAARVPHTRFGAVSEGGAGPGQRGAAVGAGRSTSVCRPSITAVSAAAATSPTGTEERAAPPTCGSSLATTHASLTPG